MSVSFVVDAILFDMDGTLVDSTLGVIGAWEAFANVYPGLNVKEILNTSHGVRTEDNLRLHCGINDPEILSSEAERFEEEIVNVSRKSKGIVLLPGVKAVFDELLAHSDVKARNRWAICTSATRKYALSALQIAGVPVPDVFVTANDVNRGKPAPDPYLLGASQCGYEPDKCLVFEDAPAGIRSGLAAGCKTIALTTTHTRQQVEAAKPDFIVQDLDSVSLKVIPEGIEVTIIES